MLHDPISCQPVVDAILHSWRGRQDQEIAPGLPVAALAIPEAVVAELGLPECCFDAVARILEEATVRAIARTVERARELS